MNINRIRNLTTIIISQANLILNTSSKKDNKLKKLNTHNQKNRSYELKEKLSTNLIIVCNYNFLSISYFKDTCSI